MPFSVAKKSRPSRVRIAPGWAAVGLGAGEAVRGAQEEQVRLRLRPAATSRRSFMLTR
jgi:hypothetical protein